MFAPNCIYAQDNMHILVFLITMGQDHDQTCGAFQGSGKSI